MRFSQLVPRAAVFAGNPAAPRWQQVCAAINEATYPQVDQLVRVAGDEGWEIAATTNTMTCFRRPAP